MREFISHSNEETLAIGLEIGQSLRKGDVVLIDGPLGAGKTVLVAGMVRGCRVEAEVLSPTYPILHVYEADVPVYHFDWYRLDDVEEFYEAGLSDFFPGDGIALVEWAEKLPEIWPQSAIRIAIEPGSENMRKITVQRNRG